MTSTNIDDFNELTGVIFAHLIRSFPHQKRLDRVAIAEELGIGVNCTETRNAVEGTQRQANSIGCFQSDAEFLPFYVDTLRWLQQEQYIRCSAKPGGRAFLTGRFELTEKAFAVLDLTPKGLKASSGESIGSMLLKAAGEAERTVRSETIRQAVKSIWKLGASGILGAG